MTRIGNLTNVVMSTGDRIARIRKLLANPNSPELPAIEHQFLCRELALLERLERVQAGRLVYAESKGEPDWIRLRDLGLEDWVNI